VRRRAIGAIGALWRGPEDWRLAYLAFGLFFLGLLSLPIVVGAFFLAAGYLLGRAAVELAREKAIPLGARRWLVYPAVLAVSLPLFLAVAFGPPIAATASAMDELHDLKRVAYRAEMQARGAWVGRKASDPQVESARQIMTAIPGPPDWAEPIAGGFVLIGSIAFWWALLGLTMWALPRWPAVIFHPLLDRLNRGHCARLAAGSGIVFLIWLGFALRFLEKAGWM
jgi:hypothetical protein